MKTEDCLNNYQYFSGKTSDLVRQLGFAGIALIWVFRDESKHSIPPELIPAGIGIVIGLSLDLLHYVAGTVVWGCFHRWKEIQIPKKDVEFLAPRFINWPGLVFFWGKIIAMGFAYTYILLFLFNEVI